MQWGEERRFGRTTERGCKMAAEGAHVSSVAGWGLFALKGQCVCQQVHTRLNGVWGVRVCGVGG